MRPLRSPATAGCACSYEGVKDRKYARERFAERGAYSADEVVDELFAALRAGAPFYILCQDHETTRAMDDGRMQWAFDDVLFRRAPLSRWSEQYKAEFKEVAGDAAQPASAAVLGLKIPLLGQAGLVFAPVLLVAAPIALIVIGNGALQQLRRSFDGTAEKYTQNEN